MPYLPLTSAVYTKRTFSSTTMALSTQKSLPSFNTNEPPLLAIPAHLYEDNIERIGGSSKQKSRKSKRELTKKKTLVCMRSVGGKRRPYVPSKLSECETADFDFETEIDSLKLKLNENERDIFIEDVAGVVAFDVVLVEEYRSWCVDTQARDREGTAQYPVARVCSVVAPCSA